MDERYLDFGDSKYKIKLMCLLINPTHFGSPEWKTQVRY